MATVLQDNDTITAHYNGTDKYNLCVPAQNIQGNFDGEKNNDFIDSASDEESADCAENTNSISYIARDVEKIDELNFDDSDISIVDDDQNVLL